MVEASSIVGALAILVNMLVVYSPFKKLNDLVSSYSDQAIILPGLTYLAMYCNSLIWTGYGILNGDNVVLFQNFVGLCIACYSLFIIHRSLNAQKVTIHPASLEPQMWFILAAFSSFCFLLAMTVTFNVIEVDTYGTFGVMLAVVQFAAPLGSLKQVLGQGYIGTLLDLRFSLLLLANGFFWSLYGIIIEDSNIYFPNIVGAILSAIQVFTFSLVPMTKDGWGSCASKSCCAKPAAMAAAEASEAPTKQEI